MKPVLPLLSKTQNNKTNHGENRNDFDVNKNSTAPTHQKMFKFLGILIGFAFRSKSCLALDLTPAFWKNLIGETPTESDLKSCDTYCW